VSFNSKCVFCSFDNSYWKGKSSFVYFLGTFVNKLKGKLELCDRCAGLGGAQCFVCKGTGVIYLEEGTKKCKACFGRGKILCRRCKGTGYSKMWF